MALKRFFSTCPKGLEHLLAEELQSLGAENTKESVSIVWFEAELEAAYRACMWSRLANRVVLVLEASSAIETGEDVYEAAKKIDWLDHFGVDQSFAVEFVGRSDGVRHTHYGALRIKDAIVDTFRDRVGRRPDVCAEQPDVRVHTRLHKGVLSIGIDLSGESLHRRAYRCGQGAAPLKENLAAAILLRADWPALAQQGYALLDPMCGSGTFLIEAAWMAADIAPGILRSGHGFDRWLGHVPVLWEKICTEAQQRREAGLARGLPLIRGYDADQKVIRRAQQNISQAGLDGYLSVGCQELARLQRPANTEFGLVLSNPPYGERLGEKDTLLLLYEHLGLRLKEDFSGWKAAIFTGNQDLAKAMGLYSHKQYSLYNGAIASKLMLIDLYKKDSSKVRPRNDKSRTQTADAQAVDVDTQAADTSQSTELAAKPVELSGGAQMLANRLKKNIKLLGKWARKNNISCYRVYDADMPEYAVAVDRYGDWIQVSEYAPPKSVDPVSALKRFREVQQAVPMAFQVDVDKIVYKQRRVQKGSAQYDKLDSAGHFFQVTEGDCRVLVNLQDYLDTGLFLDHRPLRLQLALMAKGKRFLNLFSYTSVASLHAAKGGASTTTSVDMSASYINWSKKNFALNGLSESNHYFIQADCLQWLKECSEQYDLIFLDPPSFSNSKRMEGVLDIQRDHVELINDSMRLLAKGGELIFSNNLRRFKLSDEIERKYTVKDISKSTIDMDFKRNQSIHHCWLIEK